MRRSIGIELGGFGQWVHRVQLDCHRVQSSIPVNAVSKPWRVGLLWFLGAAGLFS